MTICFFLKKLLTRQRPRATVCAVNPESRLTIEARAFRLPDNPKIKLAAVFRADPEMPYPERAAESGYFDPMNEAETRLAVTDLANGIRDSVLDHYLRDY